MKTIYKNALCALVGVGMAACSDFLDVDPHNQISDAAVWSNLDYAEAFLNNCYRWIEGDNEQGVPFCSYTDELYHRTGYATEVYTLGNVSCDNYNVGYSEGKGNTWYFYYTGIKNVNQFLERIGEVPVASDVEETQKEEMIGQAYFLRAFYYHQLYSLYGRVPLVYHTFDMDAEWTQIRADMDEVADSIVADCDRAVAILPTSYGSEDFGRATKGAALAVKARTLLYKASPLFGTPSTERWQEAADAQKAVIDLADQGVYNLPQVNGYEEYAALFCDPQNPEIIFEKMYNTVSGGAYSQSYPMSSPPGAYNGYNGWGVWLPTYDIVNLYQNEDGTDFEMTGVQKYNIQVPTVDANTGEIVYTDQTIDATKISPYENREMRLYANILYDGARWGYGEDNHPVQIYESGAEGVTSGEQSPTYTSGEYWNATQTGYYLRKFMNPDYDQWDETVMDNTPWIFFRLGEFYLNYAECLIELGRDSEALEYINKTRTRALLPALTDANNIREKYEQERAVELMFEGQRFFDLRRWKRMEDAYSAENCPTAMKIYKLGDGTLLYTHNTTILQQRNFREAMYWMPVPRYELNKCPNLDGLPYED
ncbi:RagB/SusD family nutrient uptake outer membrane protein [Phocaeicola salanitronis]|uniref:RagB/SusD family nutrient uptake outer membrane protein n=1 Tax=Phocaeicola salanitronis TaxID=376805 RepID=UPI0025A38889|nr:RagB/SusD family nutrient uptake outer membrane protein [Phocaeicola salanitronis]MDM8306358.1 RagB/SusD family nutrient uptake outer membrane protein [Phocaeicola salanitronis]